MPYRTDIVYVYDGSFPGLMCCIFDSYYKRELPAAIYAENRAQPTLFEVRQVKTDSEHSGRVIRAIKEKMGKNPYRLISRVFFSGREDKELMILDYARVGFKAGDRINLMLHDARVHEMLRESQYIVNEADRYIEFIRFSEYNNILGAYIEPKSFVLPFLAGHFADRYPEEKFVIYDRTHRAALFGDRGRCRLAEDCDISFPAAGEKERFYRNLWRLFYGAVAVEGRENPRCRMNFMPKRYWNCMTEFTEDENIPPSGELPARRGALPR